MTGYLFWPLGSLEEANDKPTPAAALKALDAAIAKEEAATAVDEAEDFSGRLLAAFDHAHAGAGRWHFLCSMYILSSFLSVPAQAHTDDVSQQGGPGAPFLAKTMSFQGEEYVRRRRSRSWTICVRTAASPRPRTFRVPAAASPSTDVPRPGRGVAVHGRSASRPRRRRNPFPTADTNSQSKARATSRSTRCSSRGPSCS